MQPYKAYNVQSTLQVFAQRRPILHRVLDWEDEFFALVTAFLDQQSLSNGSSTFAESMYGLRRAPHDPDRPPVALTKQQQNLTLLLLVGKDNLSSFLPATAVDAAGQPCA